MECKKIIFYIRFVEFDRFYETNLDVVISVVMQVEDSVKFRVTGNMQVLGRLQTFADRLPSVLLHLDVVELSGTIKNNSLICVRLSVYK